MYLGTLEIGKNVVKYYELTHKVLDFLDWTSDLSMALDEKSMLQQSEHNPTEDMNVTTTSQGNPIVAIFQSVCLSYSSITDYIYIRWSVPHADTLTAPYLKVFLVLIETARSKAYLDPSHTHIFIRANGISGIGGVISLPSDAGEPSC